MPSIQLTLVSPNLLTSDPRFDDPQIDRAKVMAALASILDSYAGGVRGGSVRVQTSTTDAVRAASEVTATTSGALGVVVNGTTVSTNFNTSQDQTATDAVANINANTTVNKLVTASKSVTNKLWVTANVPGVLGNCMTLTVTGTGSAATGGGKLTGGAGLDAPTATGDGFASSGAGVATFTF